MLNASATAQVVVVGAKSSIAAMTKEQVVAAFTGKIAGVEPLDQPEGTAIRDAFYAKEIGKSASQLRAYWAKLSFTGKGLPPKEYPNNAEVRKALAANLAAIGYIDKAAVDDSVRIVYGDAKR